MSHTILKFYLFDIYIYKRDSDYDVYDPIEFSVQLWCYPILDLLIYICLLFLLSKYFKIKSIDRFKLRLDTEIDQ